MKRKQAMLTLVRDVNLDLQDYRALHALLEEQFQAALGYRTARLCAAIECITALVDTLQARRAQRVLLVKLLLGEGASMRDAFALLNDTARTRLENEWQALEALVRQCKWLNERNCKLLMDQNHIMQRVLHGEEQIYAPA